MTQAVIFDLDGTLLNTLGDLTAAINHALATQGLPLHTEAEVRTYVGDGVRELVVRACPPDAEESTLAAVTEAYYPYYAAHNADKTAPYEGVLPLLTALRDAGVRLAVVSNKHAAGVQALCARFFGDYLELVVGADGTRPLKPAPDSLLYAMERMGVDPAHVWFVGDSTMDVQTARNAGVRCAAVTWGFHDRDRLAAENPALLADTPADVLAAILKK